MKKLVLGILSISLVVSSAYAGVSNIERSGTSSSGKTMYKVQCTNGNSYRIYKSGGEWYEASLGSVGGNYRDLNEQAKVICR